jgi:hypothetical protein
MIIAACLQPAESKGCFTLSIVLIYEMLTIARQLIGLNEQQEQ